MSKQTKPSMVFAHGADGSSFSNVGDAKGQVPLQTSAEFVRTYNAQAHEVTDAITAVVINAQAGLNLLRAQSPDLEKVRQALNSIANDGKRAGNIVVRTRALMKKVDAADGAADPRTDSPDEWPM
jgi:gamma-glutamyltranspeptidase